MELWEIHSRWRTKQDRKIFYIQDSLCIWRGFFQIGKFVDAQKANFTEKTEVLKMYIYCMFTI